MRVGILNDMAAAAPGPGDVEHWLRFACDELIAAGRLHDDIEFITAYGLGLPRGSAAAVERAYSELVEREVQLIVGPAIGDNALIATPLAERHRVPTLNWAGAEAARSDYMFQLQVGSHEDESIVLARYFAALGVQRLGVIHDRSPIGIKHLQFLQVESAIQHLSIAAVASLSPLAEQADAELRPLLDARIDALVYLGLGVAAPAVARAIAAADWQGPCAMNTAGLRGYAREFATLIDGWVYVDLHSGSNATLAALCRRLDIASARRLAAAKGYDLGRLVAEGLARAPSQSCDGVRAGLERVKYLPAAQGHDGCLLGFGHHDRGALHGRYLVLRQWRDGQSIELMTS